MRATHGPVSTAAPTDKAPDMYNAVAARRLQWDSMLWQVPALSLTAQSFLLTIAFGADSSSIARIVTAALAFFSSCLSVFLMTKHRQGELFDAEWLAEYEDRHFHGAVAHGKEWGDARREREVPGLTWLARQKAFLPWVVGLALYGVAGLVAAALAIWWPCAL